MRVEWLPEAERDLTIQVAWVAEQDPWAAIDIGEAIETAVARLGEYPAIARRGRVAETHELVVIGTPYVVVYRVEAAAVVVLRVLHGARRWPYP